MAKAHTDGQSDHDPEKSGSVSRGKNGDRMVKIQALSSLEGINPKSKGIWLLITAGFTWKETAKILHVGEATIRDVLAGKEVSEE